MMPNGLVAIIKKEFARFFTDRRMVLTTLLLPGLMIYVLYTFMGSAMGGLLNVEEDYKPSIYTSGMPASVDSLFQSAGMAYEEIGGSETDDIKQRIEAQEVDLLIVFPQGFDESLAKRYSEGAAYSPPNVEIYFNATRIESQVVYSQVSEMLSTYKTVLSPTFDINAGSTTYNLATEQDSSGFLFAMILPMVLLMFLFSGCMAVAPESIAGEKERGTIATMLVTPLGRWELALGKIISLGAIALLSGISSFIGLMLSLPNLMGATGGEEGSSVNALIYGVSDFAMLLGIVLATVLLFIGLLSVISAFAKSVKEASTMIMPLMIIVMVVGVSGMISQEPPTEFFFYLIPVYNSVQCFIGILTFHADPLFVSITVATNVLLTGLCVVGLASMFNNEKIMFAR
jgi:sodium transport system permease protein